jgi:hypothetical protein
VTPLYLSGLFGVGLAFVDHYFVLDFSVDFDLYYLVGDHSKVLTYCSSSLLSSVVLPFFIVGLFEINK